MESNIIDVTQENAQQVLIDESMNRLVVADFWADWCEPCKVLMPILEKLANEYAGQFLLAKVNADEQQMIAQQLGVRNLPTVMLIRNGQPVDGFTGAQPEGEIRQLLDKHMPKPWDIQLEQAQALIAQGQLAEAMPLLRQAYTDSRERADIAFTLAHVFIELNRCDDAQTILDAVKMVDQDANYEQLVSQLGLKREAAKSPEIQALEEKLNAEPDNLEIAHQLAVQFSQNDHPKEALELLYTILQQDKDFADGAARKTMLDVIKSLGAGDPLAAEFQRKLFGLMY